MKIENNWKERNLERLEKVAYPPLAASEESYLVRTVYSLRKKPLKDFTVEDLRIMIGQNEGLQFLIPIALEFLSENILAEGDFYPGDLLKNVLTSDAKYWKAEPGNWKTVCALFEKNEELLKTFDTTWEIRKELNESYRKFRMSY